MFERHSNPRALSLHSLRVRLASPEALPELTFLGLITGLLAGGLLIGFRELITLVSENSLFPGDEGFSSLGPALRVLLPVVGALVILLLISLTPARRRSYGIGHVIDRLHFHHGRLPQSSLIVQFLGALIALLSGFSVGREGPAVHMGAGAGSLLGQKLKLPDNSLRALAGCGSAAAISASFNTPMAGVIFAMEVVMREYSLGSFIPVMAASVVASLMTQMMYGPDPAFVIPVVSMISLQELGITALSATFIGTLAAAFIRLNLWTASKRKGHFVRSLILAGLIMGLTGTMVPEVMGIGYSVINAILDGQPFSISYLLVLVVVKLFITSVVIGLGIPGGVIGPSLFIGAAAGAIFSVMGDQYLGLPEIDSVYHALIGMVAMMAAVLQAPLAALMTVLEMTRNPHIIMPAMLAIIIASLVASQIFKQQGLFEMQLKAGGQMLNQSPLCDALCKTGVAGLMTSSFEVSPRHLSLKGFQEQCSHSGVPAWLLFEDGYKRVWAVSLSVVKESFKSLSPELTLDLCSLGKARMVKPINLQASLDDALKVMNEYGVDMLYVRSHWKKRSLISGVITRWDIEEFYS